MNNKFISLTNLIKANCFFIFNFFLFFPVLSSGALGNSSTVEVRTVAEKSIFTEHPITGNGSMLEVRTVAGKSICFDSLNIEVHKTPAETSPADSLLPFMVKIDSIRITGNDITDDDIILGELGFSEGQTVDSLILEYNRKRVYSLQLFTSVDFILSKVDSLNFLTIAVKESWYIYPIPYIDRNDSDWEKLSYGLNLTIQNFRGRNELLAGGFKVGYDPGYSLLYNIPYLFRKEEISFQTNITYTSRKNKSLTAEKLHGEAFKQQVLNASFSVGKRFSLFHRLFLTGGFLYIETPFYLPGVNASSDRIDRYGYATLSYNMDTRNLNLAPTSGIFLNADFTYKGIGTSDISYATANFDFRNYFRLMGPLHLKWRTAFRETIGNSIPYYDISILGINNRVRGHFTDYVEGRGAMVAQVESYLNLIEDWAVEFNLPPLPKKLTRYRVSIGLQAFIDMGTTRQSGGGYDLKKIQRGYGFGITVAVLPYNVARAEIAFDETGKSQIILDVGLSF
ncbi:MAG: Outer membrane protein assembly factor BamA [Ignavibacteriaceae bacterium]|nr:Outer membrane protein assembly factor BamA [Ignavibacteriaceae bacterium]OQY75100.1 MAG: hypothetical protein B6D45_06070 [Ignavibacteriales bacterium UTCHB3]